MGNDRVRGAARWLAERVPGQLVQECAVPRILEARQPAHRRPHLLFVSGGGGKALGEHGSPIGIESTL
jgi:hypothetical protein